MIFDEIIYKTLPTLPVPDKSVGAIVGILFVLYVYFSSYEKKKYNQIAAGLALYGVHIFAELINGIFDETFGFLLWHASRGSVFEFFPGAGIDSAIIFLVAGVIVSKLLPEDTKKKIIGIPTRIAIALGSSIVIIIVGQVYNSAQRIDCSLSGWVEQIIWLLLYSLFFLTAFMCHDAEKKKRRKIIIGIYVLSLITIIIFTVVQLIMLWL